MRTVSFTLNGKPTTITTDETRALLWVLRDDLGFTGTKFGCGQAVCGSCTVVVGKEAVRACATAIGDVQGKSVTTIEGLAQGDRLHPIQDAFVKHAAFQCGYCTPGMIMGAYALLLKNPNATWARHHPRTGRPRLPLRRARAHRAGRAGRGVGDERTCAMTPFDDDQEVPDGWGFVRTMDRREFLKLTGTGLLVAYAVDALFGRIEASDQQGGRGAGAPADVNAYLHIGADGRVTCLVGKIEMGQGAMTSLPQLAAEELDVPLSAVDIVMGDTDLCPFDAGTWGSLSIRQFGPVLRAAAAEAKAVLLLLAAERFQVPVSDLAVDAGNIVHKADRTKRVTYGQLTEGKRIERRLEGRPTLEARSAFTIIGTSTPRRDAVEKVTGRAKYAGDLVPPAALHARILRPPAHGATLESVDTSAAERVPGRSRRP